VGFRRGLRKVILARRRNRDKLEASKLLKNNFQMDEVFNGLAADA
jgi:hypothetical protein